MTLATLPRWDKYDPYAGNFRVPLAVDSTSDMANLVIAFGINSSGAAVVGAGQSGIAGVTILPVGTDYITLGLLPGPIAGDIIDLGKHGEIVNFVPTTKSNSLFVAGTPAAGTAYYAHSDGTVTATAGVGSIYIGHTVESSRLIVNVIEKPVATS